MHTEAQVPHGVQDHLRDDLRDVVQTRMPNPLRQEVPHRSVSLHCKSVRACSEGFQAGCPDCSKFRLLGDCFFLEDFIKHK
jgi:hypothetical protein